MGAGFASVPPRAGFRTLLGAQVHWADFGGPAEPEALCVLVHGLGGSTINWESVAPLLVDRFYCVALDLAGFGRTRPGVRRGTVDDNVALLRAFVASVAADHPGLRVLLVGNSMGGLICARYATSGPAGDSTGQAAENAADLAGVVLLDPTVPPAHLLPGPGGILAAGLYAIPVVGRAAARARRSLRTPEQNVSDTLRLCTVDPRRVAPDVVARHLPVAQRRVAHPEMDRFYSDAARSILWHLAHRRSADATYARLRVPVLLVHGTRDRLVPFSGAVRTAGRNPSWRFVPAADCGHLPMLEHPRWLAAHVHRWWTDCAGDGEPDPVMD